MTLGYMRDKLRILDPFDPRMQDGKLRISVMCGIRRRYGIPRPARPGTGLTPGGGLTWTWEGNLPIKDTGGIVNGQYNNAWIVIPSLYAKWEF